MTAWQGLKLATQDPKTWLLPATLYCIFVSAGVANFFPPVVATLGYSRTITFVLTAPPFILCCLTMLINGFHSDHKEERYFHTVGPPCVTLVANIIAVSTLNVAARYTAMMLMPASFYAISMVLLSWITGTLNQPVAKRALAIALIISVCNTPNVWTPYLYSGAPRYLAAFGVNLAAAVGAIVVGTVVRVYLKRQNWRLEERRRDVQVIVLAFAANTMVKIAKTNISPSRKFSPTRTYVSPPQPALDAPLDPSPNSDEIQGDTPTAPLQEDQYGHLHGGSSEFAFLHFAIQKLSSLPSMSIDFCDYPLTGSGSLPHVLPPKPIADELIRNYFDFGLSTSRFMHQPSFQESYELLYGVCGGGELNQGTLALVYMIMALGSHYSSTNNMWYGYSASVQFYDMANEQLQKESSRITFASLQARLLVTHYLFNHSRMHEAWSTFGIVVRQAQALGIHRRSPRPPSDHRLGEYRKRLFWVIYINDRILSSIFGRPCAIHDDDTDQEECIMANDEYITISECRTVSEGTFCSAAALVHYDRLERILGRILREFYRPAIKNQTISQLSEAAVEFDRLLNEWQDSLPAYLDYIVLPPSALSATTQRQMCTLKLAFAHAILLLHRPFILYSMETTLRKPSYLEDWVKRCHDKSIAAANMVVSDCEYLYQRGLFTRAF
ncbi:hypothetical protein CEP53_004216 [Fusarium sp. AF-6]|nr:hypothetical protein CEP53_004216 [Fusarium sp. AF-6]